MIERWVTQALAEARVARLGTTDDDGAARLVPICFAVLDGWIVSAVDHKPKRTTRLKRLDDMAARPQATVLIDHYDDGDWSRLWWIRIRGRAAVDETGSAEAVTALEAKYAQYREHRPGGAIYRIAMDEVRSWRATPGPAR